jgi:hypothetical protein
MRRKAEVVLAVSYWLLAIGLYFHSVLCPFGGLMLDKFVSFKQDR